MKSVSRTLLAEGWRGIRRSRWSERQRAVAGTGGRERSEARPDRVVWRKYGVAVGAQRSEHGVRAGHGSVATHRPGIGRAKPGVWRVWHGTRRSRWERSEASTVSGHAHGTNLGTHARSNVWHESRTEPDDVPRPPPSAVVCPAALVPNPDQPLRPGARTVGRGARRCPRRRVRRRHGSPDGPD